VPVGVCRDPDSDALTFGCHASRPNRTDQIFNPVDTRESPKLPRPRVLAASILVFSDS
jgi:hypothetical protein